MNTLSMPKERVEPLRKQLIESSLSSPYSVERRLCQTNLAYLLVFGLGRTDCNNDWVKARCAEVQANPDGYLDLWAREHYKDFCDKTPILTANRGWTEHGSLEVGDDVYSPSGSAVRVLALSPRYTDSECYRLTFSDGASAVCGAGHVWRVRQKVRRRIVGSECRTVEWVEHLTETYQLQGGEDVGVTAPLTGEPQQLPLDPYVLGAWLGDGTSRNTMIASAYSDADEMQAILEGRGVQVSRKERHCVMLRLGTGVAGKRGSSDVMTALRVLGVTPNKHIPTQYLRASIHQRMMLLRGLMDTDGHCSTRGTATFCNTNERLVDGIYELATGLGLRPRRRHYQTYWQVSFQAHQDRNPFLMRRKAQRAIPASSHRNCRTVVSIERVPSVPTRCIQVEGGLYLAGRDLLPTHNSTIITYALTIQDILRDPEITIGLFSHTRPIAKAFLRQIKQEFERNETLKAWFPDILYDNPKAESPKWSEDEGIVVKRKGNPKEATVEASGVVDGQPTSKHFALLVYDDVVTRESVSTPDMMAKTTDALALSFNLGAHGGKRRFIGTRYHYNDTYRTVIDRGIAKPRIYAATEDGKVEGEPVFLTREALADKRRDQGPYVFACFAAGTQILMSDWSEKAISDVDVGDEIVGYTFGVGQRSRLARSKVIARQSHRKEAFRYTFESGHSVVCTEDHKFWQGRAGRGYAPLGFGKSQLSAACMVYNWSDASGEFTGTAAGYLAGIFDGEGCVSGNTFHIAQCRETNPAVCERIEWALNECGFDWSVCNPVSRPHHNDYYLTGGRAQKIRFARLMRGFGKAARVQEAIFATGSRYLAKSTRDKLVSVEPIGEIEVFNIQTETGNYVANGYAAKNCQMLQDPKADETQGFKQEWLRYASVSQRGQNLVILVDAASAKKKTSDYTSAWCLGLGADKNVYVHDMVRDRLSLTERADLIMAWHRKWQPQAVGYEQYGMMADIEHIKDRQDRENYRFDIKPLGGAMPKVDRIRRLIPWFERGRIFLMPKLTKTNYEGRLEDLTQAFINDEYLAFPVAAHDDMLDALARFLDPDLPVAWPRPIEYEPEDEFEAIGRDSITGY